MHLNNQIVTGTIVKGYQRGRLLGFPTANIYVKNKNINFESGVYAGLIKLENSNLWLKTAVSIGQNLTFDQADFTIEAYILDFDQDIYHTTVELKLIQKIRNMEKYSSQSELVNQIRKDVMTVETILSKIDV